jgi:hypothetical protein
MKWIYALAAIVTIILVILIAGRLYTSNVDFNPGNPYWNGYSKFYAGNDLTQLYHLSDLPAGDTSGTTLLVVSPSYRYRPDDAAAIESYMIRGGSLIVMDDFGESDSLLKSLNTSIQLLQVPLYQEDNLNESSAFPVISNVSGTGLTVRVSQIYTNHPAALKAGYGTIIIASTNNRGWIDTGQNRIDNKEVGYDAFPIIAMQTYGSGSLTVISDPSIFVNGMIGQGDNSRLASNVFEWNKVYIDLSHSAGTPSLMSAFDTIRTDGVAQILLITVLLLLCFISFITIRRFYPGPGDESPDGIQEEDMGTGDSDQASPGQTDDTNNTKRGFE